MTDFTPEQRAKLIAILELDLKYGDESAVTSPVEQLLFLQKYKPKIKKPPFALRFTLSGKPE